MKTNLILFLLSLILGVPCYFTLRSEDIEYRQAVPYLFPGFVPDNVTMLQIQRRKPEDMIKAQKIEGAEQFDVLVFQRTPGGWQLAMPNHVHSGMPVDSKAIDRNILDHIKQIRIDSQTLVKQDATPEYRKENELTPETGIIIQCKLGPEGPDVATLVLGKSTKKSDKQEELDGFLVCRPDRPREVILYEPVSKRWDLSLRSSDWLDKSIHSFALSNVERFYYKNVFGSAGFKLKPGSQGTWIPIKEQCSIKKIDAPRQMEIRNLLVQFLRVNAESYGRGKIDIDMVGAKIEVRVKLKTGEEIAVWVKAAAHDAQHSMCVSSERKFLFAWSAFHVGAFENKDPKDLFD